MKILIRFCTTQPKSYLRYELIATCKQCNVNYIRMCINVQLHCQVGLTNGKCMTHVKLFTFRMWGPIEVHQVVAWSMGQA